MIPFHTQSIHDWVILGDFNQICIMRMLLAWYFYCCVMHLVETPNAPFAVYGTPMTKMVNARIWQIIWTFLIYFRKIFYNAQRIKCKGNPKMWRQLIHKFFCNLLLDIILTSIGTRIGYARLQPVLRPRNIESNAQKWTVCLLRPSVSKWLMSVLLTIS